MEIDNLKGKISSKSFDIFSAAWKHSGNLQRDARKVIEDQLKDCNLDLSQICISVVGSTARCEAMEASDIDLLPIWSGEEKKFDCFEKLTEQIRKELRVKLKLNVSTSRDLMKISKLSELCKADGIGGGQDYRRSLTQRMFVLTESSHLGGELKINHARRKILEAYVGGRGVENTTVSKHPLTVCNDIARYYRTLCVDYKSGVETKPESWAERHAKLRNARKLWYFGTLLALSKNVADIPKGEYGKLFDALEQTFDMPPILRLFSAANDDTLPQAIKILDIYAQYLDKMSDPGFRESLTEVRYEERDDEHLEGGNLNPYKDVHARSREMSDLMIKMMLASEEKVRSKVFNWFFL